MVTMVFIKNMKKGLTATPRSELGSPCETHFALVGRKGTCRSVALVEGPGAEVAWGLDALASGVFNSMFENPECSRIRVLFLESQAGVLRYAKESLYAAHHYTVASTKYFINQPPTTHTHSVHCHPHPPPMHSMDVNSTVLGAGAIW